MIYDVIIIGSGISGLYSAYKIKQHKSFLVLEKHKKTFIGGRAGNDTFYGVNVVTGAGIGRKRKDKLLYRVVNDFHLETHIAMSKKHYSSDIVLVPMDNIMSYLRNQYTERTRHQTFKQFATYHLGQNLYKQFLETSGYTDYEKEDAYETLYHYGMDDNYKNSMIFTVPWKELVSKFIQHIGESNIKTGNGVTKITKKYASEQGVLRFHLETELGTTYICNHVIIATDINGIRALLPNPIYKEIEGQPFVRIYGKFTKQSIPFLKQNIYGYTCVKGVLQKIIPMDVENGVYMIAYSDNANALALSDHLENTPDNREYFCRMVEQAVGIQNGMLILVAIKSYYWTVGTHYYKPLKNEFGQTREEFIQNIQHPTDGVFVVGEAVSRNQGWTEGALESVEKVVTHKWIMS